MNFRKKQGNRFSERWWKYNRKYWAKWAIDAAKKRAAKYEEFFKRKAT
jgi:hypothetical protein